LFTDVANIDTFDHAMPHHYLKIVIL